MLQSGEDACSHCLVLLTSSVEQRLTAHYNNTQACRQEIVNTGSTGASFIEGKCEATINHNIENETDRGSSS